MFSPQMQEQVFLNIKKVWPVKDCRFSIRTRKTSNHVKKMASLSAGLPAPPFVIHLRMIQDLGKVFFWERNVLFLYNDNSVYKIHIDHLMKKCKKNMFFFFNGFKTKTDFLSRHAIAMVRRCQTSPLDKILETN